MAKNTTMSTGKKIGISIGVLVFILCLAVCCWYVYILEYGADKLTSTVINPGVLQTQDGSSKYVIEVDYKANQNGNGLELFDIKLNYFTDSSREHTYTQGIQYVANNPEDKIEWVDYEDYSDYLNNVVKDYLKDKDSVDLDEFSEYISKNFKTTTYTLKNTGWWVFGTDYKASYYNVFADATLTSRYEYEALDDNHFTGSTNPISAESSFLLQVGENSDEFIRMKFKGDNYIEWTSKDEFKNDNSRIAYSGDTNYYYNYNVDYLAYTIYQAIQELPAGTQGAYVFEYGDIFNYFEGAEEGNEINKEDTDKVTNEIKSYYTIYVKISADGARNSKDSSFGILHGSPTFTLDGSGSSAGDYFQGKAVINLDVYDFELVLLTDDYYGLRLKQSFIDEYLPYAKNIYLSITIDVSIIENAGYKYSGLLEDSGLSYFEVLEVEEINSSQEVA